MISRRQLLAGTATIAAAAVLPKLPVAPRLTLRGVPVLFDPPFNSDWRYLVRAANVQYTIYYCSDEALIEFTGFRPMVPYAHEPL